MKKQKVMSQEELKEGLKFSKEEMAIVHETAQDVLLNKCSGQRNMVTIAVVCSILENVIVASGGIMSKKPLLKIIDLGTNPPCEKPKTKTKKRK